MNKDKNDILEDENWKILRLQEEKNIKDNTQRILLKHILTGEIREVFRDIDDSQI